MITLAIQDDLVHQPNGLTQSFSSRWKTLAHNQDIAVQTVDVYSQDILHQIAGCDGFMWRFGFDPLSLRFAKRLLPAISHGMGMPIFPNWRTSWHFEDKVSQRYLLEAAGIPMPATWVFWREDDAVTFCRTCAYPIVAKFSSGIRSNNVILLRNASDAERLIRQMFSIGLPSLRIPKGFFAKALADRRLSLNPWRKPNLHHGYFYFQEFLEGNDYDTRVTVIGDRAFAFRRFNRDDDFRASGSGKISWNPGEVDLNIVRLAFQVADQLGTQTVAIDGMYRGREIVVGEISYTYAAWAIAKCEGHWRRTNGATCDLQWVEGEMLAEDAIFSDFVSDVRQSGRISPKLHS